MPPSRPERPHLPVDDIVPELCDALADVGRAVLVAPPGAGKTTVVPLALLEESPMAEGRIVMLEPRRLATRAAAQRMADTTATEPGDVVGYQTRDERRIGPHARVEVVTEGVLTRRLQNDPTLPGVACVIFDEVHERNLTTDLGMAMTLDVVDSIRPDLWVLAMSATPDTEGLRRVLEAPVIESAGTPHDVEIRWLPPAARGRRKNRPVGRSDIETATATAVLTALSDGPGDVLVFLPGVGEIRRVEERLRAAIGPNIDVWPLAGALGLADQDRALAPSPAGRRRVVLSTDIAETSLTVDGVRIVVDAGLSREPRFDPRTGMTKLTTVAASRASADQRAGRAGRLGPGTAYRLWSKIEHGSRPRHRAPEILEADLAGLALELAAWGSDDLAFIDRPPRAALDQARALLGDLRALDADGAITELGRQMLGLPVHPRLARMVAVDRSPLACVVATLVEERDVLRGRLDDLPVDLGVRVEVIAGRSHDRADRGAVRRLRERARDLARRADVRWEEDAIDADRTGAVLLWAYPDRLAGRRRPGQFQLRSGTGAWIPTDDPLASERFVVAADLDGRRDRARIRLAAAVDDVDVLAAFGDDVREHRKVAWDAERGDLTETVDRRLGAISLGRRSGPAGPGEETTDALMSRVRATSLDALVWTDSARSLRARVGFLRRTHGEPWPDWSTETLLSTLDTWLAPYLPGATGRADLERLDVTTVLRSQLPWPEGAELDRLAPPVLELPTGRSVPIRYDGEQPEAEVRVQDLFGVTEHPDAGGHAIRLHLLSPADRPIQVTTDLPGFWSGSWAEVRKEMAGRYPKHAWPVDPASAPPRRLKDDR